MLIKKIVVGPIETNCYIVADPATRNAIVIDPGADAERILDVISTEKLSVKYIALTHAHYDHFLALDPLQAEIHAEVLMHRADEDGLRHVPSVFGRIKPPASKIDRFLEDGDHIRLDSLDFLVLHTPGHTEGGISLYADQNLFCGDTLFRDNVGRCDLPGGDLRTIISSIRQKLFALPDDTCVFCGHGEDTTIGHEKRYNPYAGEELRDEY